RTPRGVRGLWVAPPWLRTEGPEASIAQITEQRVAGIPKYHLFVRQALQHIDLRPARPLEVRRHFSRYIACLDPSGDQLRQGHGIFHGLHASLRRVWIHRMRG